MSGDCSEVGGDIGNNRRPEFGNRYLTEEDDVYRHNAWDDVDWNQERENEAREAVAKNSQVILSSEEIGNLEKEADAKWDAFYSIHNNRFFKDRNWLFTEFSEMNDRQQQKENEENSNFKMLELGCGVGNTVFPILQHYQNPKLTFYASDFSSEAVKVLKENPEFPKFQNNLVPFVLNIADPEDWAQKLKDVKLEKESVDFILLIFVLSALDPDTFRSVIDHAVPLLKPGGYILIRDYGKYDLAQLRFKKGRCLKEDFYSRGDGTRCYFFTTDKLRELFVDQGGLEEVQNRYDRRLQVNRGKKLKMYRVWVQAKFRKKKLN